MIVHRAAWVLPIAAPPIRDGWVAVHGDRVAAVGGPADVVPGSFATTEPPSARAILPGLVNAHVHLELSWMRGAVPPAASMPAWASQLITVRRAQLHEPVEPIGDALREARASGTSLVGDVTNTLASYYPLADSPLCAAVFFEQLGFASPDPAVRAAEAQSRLAGLPHRSGVHAFVAPHAPYSVSPALLRAIGNLAPRVLSIHLAESPDEVQFLRDGSGAWRTLLEALGVWDRAWTPPGCGPVDYLAALGLVNDRLLAVHGVQLSDAELAALAAAGATLVTCPRSNVWTGAGPPPIARFYRSGIKIAVGTDSLASVEDLNVFSEIAAMHAMAPDVPAGRLLESATRVGAEALGFGGELGIITRGARAQLLAVALPEGVADVEQYLVCGIRPDQIAWLPPDPVA